MKRHPLTEARKKTFLKVLSETGSPTAAASAATPWSKHRQGGLASFRDEAKRDVEFAAAWERAQQDALAAVEKEIVRRAMEPPRRAVWSKGELVGWTEDRNSSDKLLLRLAARLDPQWRERTTVDQNVSVQATVFALTPQDVPRTSATCSCTCWARSRTFVARRWTMETKVLDFLHQVEIARLKAGRNGIRVVGDGTTYSDGAVTVGLVVPDGSPTVEEWLNTWAPEDSEDVSVP